MKGFGSDLGTPAKLTMDGCVVFWGVAMRFCFEGDRESVGICVDCADFRLDLDEDRAKVGIWVGGTTVKFDFDGYLDKDGIWEADFLVVTALASDDCVGVAIAVSVVTCFWGVEGLPSLDTGRAEDVSSVTRCRIRLKRCACVSASGCSAGMETLTLC